MRVPGLQGIDSGPQAHLGRGNKPKGGATILPPHVAILNFYLGSYLSRSLAVQAPKKFSLKNVLLIVVPWEALLEVWEHLPLSCRMSHGGKKRVWWAPCEAMMETWERPPPFSKTSMAGPQGGNDGDPGAPTTYLEDVDGGPPGRR
jgi:hypothetical protein